jgi:hypothetical protein
MLASSARRLFAVVALGLALTACAEENKAAPEASPTPIGSLNTVAMQLPRIEFCALVPDAAVSDALGAKPVSNSSYGNGDEVDLPGVGKDVVHEIGCVWTAKDGTTARAWVFGRPITPQYARTVIASAKATKGCRTVPGPPYGKPATTQQCQRSDGVRVRHAGLFRQTWLTCELAATGTDITGLRKRTDAWCVEIANTLNTAR